MNSKFTGSISHRV